VKRLPSCGGSKDKGIPTGDQDGYWPVQTRCQYRVKGVQGVAGGEGKIKRYAPEIRMVRPTTQYMTG
jgi:hypothetical protein